MTNNNRVTLSGIIKESFSFSNEMLGEKFYKSFIICKRTSNNEDIIPIIVSEKLINTFGDCCGKYVTIKGDYRTYNQKTENGIHLISYVFVHSIEITEVYKEDINEIALNGYVCKYPIIRETPFGRKICDLLIAVNRNYNKSDYIPCIVWGRKAYEMSSLNIGSNVLIYGRIQSRAYKKNINGEEYDKTAYEISVTSIEYN